MSVAAQAGILIIALMAIGWFIKTWRNSGVEVAAKTTVSRGQVALGHTKTFITWSNPDMIVSVFVAAFCAFVWLKFNINNGNVVAIEFLIGVINQKSTTGGIPKPDFFTMQVLAAMPSIIQLWLLQFSPEGSNRELVGWAIMAIDILVTAFGFWVGSGLTLNVWVWGWLEYGLFASYLLSGFIVNFYVELIGHDCLIRFYLTVLGKNAKGLVTKVNTAAQPSAAGKSKKTKAKK